MLPRFKNILVPVDFVEKSLAALDIAFELAVANRARITLLHIIESVDVEYDAEMEQFYDRLEKRADSELERMAQRFLEAGLECVRRVRVGKRLAEILQSCTEHGTDLVIMRSHKPDLQQPYQTWATLSYQVSVLCPCPVLLVK
jgi:universal stress protein A